MKKLATKLMISVLSVALAFIALGTSTFAWFSMNTTVEATGMQLTAVTPVNLLINDANNDTWANTVTADETAVFGTHKLYPASSADGKTFNAIMNTGNYIGNGLGGGADTTTKFQQTSKVTAAALSGSVDGYYAVYTFKLKLSEHQDADESVYLSKFNVYQVVTVTAEDNITDATGYKTESAGVYTAPTLTDGKLAAGTYYREDGIANAVRGALFVGNVNGDALTGSETAKAIYAKTAGSTNAITQTFAADDTAFDGTSKTATSAVVPVETTYDFPVNENAVNVKLVVWVEGEDAACLNANAGQTFKIDLAFAVNQA